MLDWPAIMAQGGDSGGELLYVIAILILAGIGVIADKIKQKMAGQSKPPAKQPGTPEVPRSEIQVDEAPRRPAPLRPAATQQQRQAPRPPVVWEAPQPRQPQRPQAPPRLSPAAQRLPQERRGQPGPAPPPPVTARSVVSVTAKVAPAVGAAEGRPAQTQLGTTLTSAETNLVAGRELTSPTGQPAQVFEVKRPGIEWLGLSLADLPRAVVLSEILSPPISLRRQEHLF